MKNNRGKGAAGLVILLAALIGFVYLAYISLVQNKITLGLDLAGGVSITYQAKEANPSAQDMSDTIYKLQQRVGTPMKRRSIRKERTGSTSISPAFPTQTRSWRIWDSPVPFCSLSLTAKSS